MTSNGLWNDVDPKDDQILALHMKIQDLEKSSKKKTHVTLTIGTNKKISLQQKRGVLMLDQW